MSSLDKEIYRTFFRPYCEICERAQFPKIWKSHQDKLPTEQTIESLMLRWDTLGKRWNDNDIFQWIIPNVAGNIACTPHPPLPSQDLRGARHFVKTAHRVVHAAHFSGTFTHAE